MPMAKQKNSVPSRMKMSIAAYSDGADAGRRRRRPGADGEVLDDEQQA